MTQISQNHPKLILAFLFIAVLSDLRYLRNLRTNFFTHVPMSVCSFCSPRCGLRCWWNLRANILQLV